MILILTGPSGSGKSTIANKLCKHYGFTRIRTITTRPKRYASDHEYEFVTTKVFEDLVSVGRITSVRSVPSSSEDDRILYGIPTISIRSDMNYVIILDPKGAVEFKQRNNDKGRV